MIINLTQHASTPEQRTFEPANKSAVQALLTFEYLPTAAEIGARAVKLAVIAAESCATSAMIGGAPYLMPALKAALHAVGVQPLYAFSSRESVDQVQADGTIRKVAVFRHLGFVEAPKRDWEAYSMYADLNRVQSYLDTSAGRACAAVHALLGVAPKVAYCGNCGTLALGNAGDDCVCGGNLCGI